MPWTRTANSKVNHITKTDSTKQRRTNSVTVTYRNDNVRNYEKNTASSLAKIKAPVNKISSIIPNDKMQPPLADIQKSEQPMIDNKMEAQAIPSNDVNKIDNSRTEIQLNTTNRPIKSKNSAVCNDKLMKRKPFENGNTNKAALMKHTWNRKVPPINKATTRETKESSEQLEMMAQMEPISTQTDEMEILYPSTIADDVKILKPSKLIVMEIDKQREELKKKEMLKAKKKFEKHSARQEAHINNLNEFLERSYITKKERPKSLDTLEEDKRLITSMDQLLKRRIPKIESVTNIKERIRRREQELLKLFDKTKVIRNSKNKK